MPGRAFIPGQLAQAQPRVYKAFRGRQLRGLLLAGAGAALGLALFGVRTVAGYGVTFALALPGFAYGYFQPEGKPVEYWVAVVLRYYFRPRSLHPRRGRPWWRRLGAEGRYALRVVRRARAMRQHKEVLTRG